MFHEEQRKEKGFLRLSGHITRKREKKRSITRILILLPRKGRGKTGGKKKRPLLSRKSAVSGKMRPARTREEKSLLREEKRSARTKNSAAVEGRLAPRRGKKGGEPANPRNKGLCPY